jgi:hypothetical protein
MAFAATVELRAIEWSFPNWLLGNGAGKQATVDVAGNSPIDAWPGAEAEVSALARLYVFTDFQAVRNLLFDTAEVRAVLFEAYARVAEGFGDDAQLLLAVERDLEGDDPDELFLLIAGLPEESYRDALARLAALDRTWWRDASRLAPRLNIDLE